MTTAYEDGKDVSVTINDEQFIFTRASFTTNPAPDDTVGPDSAVAGELRSQGNCNELRLLKLLSDPSNHIRLRFHTIHGTIDFGGVGGQYVYEADPGDGLSEQVVRFEAPDYPTVHGDEDAIEDEYDVSLSE